MSPKSSSSPSLHPPQDALLAGLARLPKTLSPPLHPHNVDVHSSSPIDHISLSTPQSSSSYPQSRPRPQLRNRDRDRLAATKHDPITSAIEPATSPTSATGTPNKYTSLMNLNHHITPLPSVPAPTAFNFNNNASINTLVSPRIVPFHPVSRVDVQETVERATGLAIRSSSSHSNVNAINKSTPAATTTDRIAVDRLLFWIRSGSVDATTVFRMIVAGTDVDDPHFNIGVLSIAQVLCMLGGPNVLAGALHVTHPRRPSAILRIVIDILRTQQGTAGGGFDPEAMLYDDQLVDDLRREVLYHIDGRFENDIDILSPSSSASRANHFPQQRTETKRALQAYALMLGRKYIFHQRFLDIEVSYSLDRFFRAFHLENERDPQRCQINAERQAMIISQPALADVTVIATMATITAILLERVHANRDAFIFTLADAVNAAAFQAYLARKQGREREREMSEYRISKEIQWLGAKTAALIERPTSSSEAKLLKKLIDANVYRWLQNAAKRDVDVDSNVGGRGRPPSQSTKTFRPESRNRKEILCHFSSFRNMHEALAPKIPPLSYVGRRY